MSLEDCYEDKKLMIGDFMKSYPLSDVISELYYDIEHDEDYTLSTDEITELSIKLVKMWVKREL